jgi:large subunit ribosomal protein L6
MSRIGKLPIDIPSGVTITVDQQMIVVTGPKGKLETPVLDGMILGNAEGKFTVSRASDTKIHKSFHGLMRTLISNMVIGVTKGFDKKLEINGVGYKANLQGRTLNLALGFSHDINYALPEGIDVKVEQNTVTVSGINKQAVGQVAAEIRAFKKPEPYKGKGIKYEGERILRKSGKSGKDK